MLVMEDITKLVTDTSGYANGLIDVSMGMPVNPVVDATGLYVVRQFNCECAIYAAAQKLWRHQLERRDMMCDNYLMLSSTLADRLLDEVEAPLVFAVEIGRCQDVITKHDTMEVRHTLLRNICVL